MRMEIPFCGPAYQSQSPFLSSAECINFYPRPYPALGETALALFATPGLEHWITPSSGEIRGLFQHGIYVYAVSGDRLYRITSEPAAEELGTINTNVGQVSMASNGSDLILVDGVSGYVWDYGNENFVEILDPDFPICDVVVQIDGWYLVPKKGTNQVWRSDYQNGTSWSGLAFSSEGSQPDDVVSLIVDRRDVWVLGNWTSSIWRNTGASTFNFARLEGTLIDQGIVGPHARCKINNAIFWVGQDRGGHSQVFQATNRSPKVISDFPISSRISNLQLSDCFSFSYQQEGHNFSVFTFPFSDETWVYDSTTSMWHRRSSRINSNENKWRVNCHTVLGTDHIVGDFFNGKIYKMKTDVYDEDGTPIISRRVTPTIRKNQNRITYDSLRVMFETGVGLDSGQGSDPKAVLRWSDDGGRTWSSEIEESIGALGDYSVDVEWHQLGQGRNRVWDLWVSDPVKRVILGAVAEVEVDDA